MEAEAYVANDDFFNFKVYRNGGVNTVGSIRKSEVSRIAEVFD